MADTIIELTELTKVYDRYTAVDHLTLTIRRGEIFGLLGPNGAGKSTTILMMLGLTEPTSGTVRVCGLNSTRQPLDVKKRVGYLPDDVGFYEDLTGFENLVYTASLNGLSRQEGEVRASALLKLVGLEDAADKKAGKYSRGMRQRLGLADVLVKHPELIILDEPTLGIDPEGVRDFLNLIKRLNEEEELTVLVSSHHLHQVQEICDRVGLFVEGKLLAEGDVHSLAMKLFSKELIVIRVQASPLESELVRAIEQLPQVERVEEGDDGQLDIYGTEDVTSEIARLIVDSGASLHHISKKDYSLDEIYHRYFAGGDRRGESRDPETIEP